MRNLRGALSHSVVLACVLSVAPACSGPHHVQDRTPSDSFSSSRNSGLPRDPAGARRFFLEQRLAPGMTSYPTTHVRDQHARLRDRRPQGDPGCKSQERWVSLGPGNIGGRTRALVIDPLDPETMYAGGVAGGVWKSTDAGGSWHPQGDQLPNLAISCLALDPSNPDVVFAGTGEGLLDAPGLMQRGLGIFRSLDRGETWTHLSGTVDGVPEGAFHWVNDIVVSPTQTGRVYAATRFGVWRSLDGGDTWSVVLANPWYVEAESESRGCTIGATDLAIGGDSHPDVIFAAFGSYRSDGLYRSTDGGDTWTRLPLDVQHQGRMSVAFAPSDGRFVYVSMAQNRNGSFGKLANVFRSEDGGDSWQGRVDHSTELGPWLLSLSAGALGCMDYPMYNMGEYANAIAVDPVDPEVVWLGSVYLYRSDDGARTFGFADGRMGGPLAYYRYNHPDNHAIVFHPFFDGGSNQTLFVASDGGIARTDLARGATGPSFCPLTGTVTWTNLNNGYSVTQFYHGATTQTADLFIGGAHDNGTSLVADRDQTSGWATVFLGDGGYVAVDPRNPDVLYYEFQGFPTIYKSTNGGVTSIRRTVGITDTDGLFVTPFAMDPTDPDVLWTGGTRPFRTVNGALRWYRVGDRLAGAGRISCIAVAPSDGEVVYVGFHNGVVAHTANGRGESPVWAVDEQRESLGYVSSIAVDRAEPDRAFCTVSTFGLPHVLQTTDAGATWTAIEGSGEHRLPDIPAHWIAQRPCDRDELFVGTELGVFRSDDGGLSWRPFNPGLPNTIVETLTFKDNNTLVAFTFGRGAFLVELDPCEPPPPRHAPGRV